MMNTMQKSAIAKAKQLVASGADAVVVEVDLLERLIEAFEGVGEKAEKAAARMEILREEWKNHDGCDRADTSQCGYPEYAATNLNTWFEEDE